MNERLKKLAFRASHRGMKELDLVIGGFADAHLENLSDSQLDEFEDILHVPDPDLYAWLTGQADVPDEHKSEVMTRLREFSLEPADYTRTQ